MRQNKEQWVKGNKSKACSSRNVSPPSETLTVEQNYKSMSSEWVETRLTGQSGKCDQSKITQKIKHQKPYNFW